MEILNSQDNILLPEPQKNSFFKELSRLLFNDSHLRNYIPYLSENHDSKKFRLIEDCSFFLGNIGQDKDYWNTYFKRDPYDPTSYISLSWYFLQFSAFVYFFFEVGLVLTYGEVVWQAEIFYTVCLLLNYLIFFAWIGEIILGPNRGYFADGFLVMQQRRILANYLKYYALIDIICPIILLICIISQNYNLNWAKLFFIFKLVSIHNFDVIFQRVLNNKRMAKAIYIIVRILLIIVALCHIIGLIFYSIDLYILMNGIFQPQFCWLNSSTAYNNIIGQPWNIQYLYTFYWGVNTMTTISYGDIAAYNPYQVIYILICFILALLIYWYALSVIVTAIFWAKQDSDDFMYQLTVLDTYMRRNKISQNIQIKVRQYLQFLFMEESFRNFSIEEKMMAKLPQQMREAVIKDAFKMFYLKLLPTYKDFPQGFLDQLIYQVKQQKYAINQILFEQGQYENNHKIYLLCKGKIDFIVHYASKKQNRIGEISLPNRIFGQYEFYTGQRRRYQAISGITSTVYSLERKVLKKFIQDRFYEEYFRKMFDEIIYKKDYQMIGYTCYFCDMLHKFEDCSNNLINFRTNFKFESKKANSEHFIQRDLRRMNSKKLNVLSLMRKESKISGEIGGYKIRENSSLEFILKQKIQKRLTLLYQQIKLLKDNFEVDRHYDWRFYEVDWNFSGVARKINHGK